SDIDKVHEGKYYILNYGIPPIENSDTPRNNEKPVIVYLSNFVKSKGIIIFLETAKKLKERGVPFNAIAIGNDGDYTINEAKDFVRSNDLPAHVTISGPLYGKEKFDALRKADIFVFPTFYKNEAFPVCILEAFQCALPVISTYNAAIPDII